MLLCAGCFLFLCVVVSCVFAALPHHMIEQQTNLIRCRDEVLLIVVVIVVCCCLLFAIYYVDCCVCFLFSHVSPIVFVC